MSDKPNKKELKKIKQQIYGNPNWITGRINRWEFFARTFLTGLTFVIAVVIAGILYAKGLKIPCVLCGVFAAWMYWRIIMAYVKRLHDLGWSGWWAILIFCEGLEKYLVDNDVLSTVISVIVFVLSLLLVFWKGNHGVNKYGKDPLMKYEENQ